MKVNRLFPAAGVVDEIRSEPCPDCPLCGARGAPLYKGLADRIGTAPGRWNISKCGRCGLAWVDPMPRQEDLGKAYGDYFMHQQPPTSAPGGLRLRLKRGMAAVIAGYGASIGVIDCLLAVPLSFLPPVRERSLASVMHLRWRTGCRRLLDVGCATGAFLEFMCSLGWDVDGVEMDPDAARIAQEHRGLRVRAGTVEAQGFPACTFDAVTLSHVIEHVPDPVTTLRECKRVLRPGGRLVVTTPNLASRGHTRFGSAWLHLDPPRHLHIFSRESLRRTAEAAGLHIDELRSSIRFADGAYMASREIEETGRTRMGVGWGPGVQLRAVVFQYAEWFETLLDPERGEELVLIAN